MNYLLANTGNIIVGFVVIVGIFFAVKSQLNAKKNGGCSGCSSCSTACNHSSASTKANLPCCQSNLKAGENTGENTSTNTSENASKDTSELIPKK